METINEAKNNRPENKTSKPDASPKSSQTPHSRIFKIVVTLLAELILLIGVFSLGMNVGFKKAGFTYDWSQNYSNNFGGRLTPIQAPPNSQLFNAHGLDGTILTIDKGSIILKDEDGNEKTVDVSAQTTIRQNFKNITAADLKTGEEIVVIGEPNPRGQIEAKLIRALN